MIRKTTALLCAILVNLPVISFAQDWIGYHTSNYAGVHAVQFNPAFIAGNHYKLDVSIVAGHLHAANNYININSAVLTNYNLFSEPNFKDRYITEQRGGSGNKSAFLNLNLQAPAFLLRVTNYDAIAFAPRIRAFVNGDNVDPTLAKLILEGLDYPPFWNQVVNNDYVALNANIWAEYGVSYGRIIYADNVHVFKGGITVKLLQGLGAGYFNMRDYSYNFYNDDTVGIFRTQGNFGHSPNFDNNNFRFNFEAAPSVGVDVGFIYEYCPKTIDKEGLYHPKKYVKKFGIDAGDKTKYLWRAGVSINDIGSLKYRKSDNSRDFLADVDSLPLSVFENVNSVASFDQAINANFTQTNQDAEFWMDLPTQLTAFFDYRFDKGFAMNATLQVAFNAGKVDNHKNHYLTQFTLTPRWESRWFGVYMPLSYNELGLINFGISGRAGPLVIGTGNIVGALVSRKFSTLNIHFGLRIILPDGKKGKNTGPLCPAYR